MTILPGTDDSLLVRTDFSDPAGWAATAARAVAEGAEGFRAYVTVIDDRGMEGLGWEELREAVRATGRFAAVLFIADAAAFTDEHPILVVDLAEPARPPFRCIATELWAVETNLNIANMDWEDFSDDVQQDGVYRGIA